MLSLDFAPTTDAMAKTEADFVLDSRSAARRTRRANASMAGREDGRKMRGIGHGGLGGAKSRLRSCLACLVLLPLALATPARAEEPNQFEERRAVYTRGLNAMLEQNWVEAERIFAELFRSQRTWDVAVSLGQSELNLRRYRDAAEHLNYGVENFPIRDKRDAFEDAKAGLEEAKRHVGTLRISVNHEAVTLRVDGDAVGRSPLASPIFVEPGKHTLVASLAGYPDVSREIEVLAGSSESVELRFGAPTPEASASAASPSGLLASGVADGSLRPEGRRSLNFIPLIVGGALVLGGVGTFVGFTLAANQNESTLEDFTDEHGTTACGPSASSQLEECADIAREGRTLDKNRNFATAGAVVAGAAAVGTLAYYLLVPSSKRAVSSETRGVLRRTRVNAGVSPSIAKIDLSYAF